MSLMNLVPPSIAERHARMLWPTAVWTLAGVLVYLWAPLTASYLLPLTFVAPALWAWAGSRRVPFYWPSTFFMVLALAGVYLLINAARSINPAAAYIAVGLCFLFIASLHLTLQSLSHVETAPLAAMANGLVLAMSIGGALLFIEVVSQQWLHRELMNYLPWFRPHPRHMATVEDVVVYLQPYLMNRSMAALTLLLWPCVLCIALLPQTPAERRWRLSALLLAVAAIFLSKHATSKIAFLGSAATFAALHAFPLLAKRAIVWGWVATILLVVPLAALAYRGGLYLSDRLPHSAQHRIVIWGTTTQEIVKTPMLGAGIYATRGQNEPESFDVRYAPGSDIQMSTGWHSHNVYLQTWYEGGAIGALMLLGVGLVMLRSLALAPPDAQPYLFAAFVACALMGGSSFSLWQPWFLASFGFVAVFASVGGLLVGRGYRPSLPGGNSAQPAA
jgi:O-antigen ligase